MATRKFYGQPGLNVAAYDHLATEAGTVGPVRGDVEFYRALADEHGGPVIELACGTGRVAIPLAEAGHEIVGVDRSAPMLAIAEEKRRSAAADVAERFQFVEGDMRDLDLGRTFRLAIIAFRSFAHLLTVEDQRRCLATVHRHLEPGGILALNVFDPRLDLCLPGEAGDYPMARGTATLPDTGTTVEVVATTRANDPVRQLMVETWQFTERGPDGSVLRQELEELTLRWMYRYELHHLLELSGFELVAEYSDFAKSPPVYAGELVVVARRSA